MLIALESFYGKKWINGQYSRSLSRYSLKKMKVFPSFVINGFDDSHPECDRCGRRDLKGTFSITTDEGGIFHLGSQCVKKSWQMGDMRRKKAKKDILRHPAWFASYEERLSIARDSFFEKCSALFPHLKEDREIMDETKKKLALKLGIKKDEI
jgi:hypothetical protein